MLITHTVIDKIVAEISNHVKNQYALISIGEHTEIDILQLIASLNNSGVKFMGGLFPMVIHDHSIYKEGLVINTLNYFEDFY